MKKDIPEQLKNPDYRFFLARTGLRWGKLPLEKRWNSDNCYMFFEPKLIKHIESGNNVGVCTGFGNLIVIDFDDKEFQDKKAHLLPKTFTVRTACKRLKHMYYNLEGDMISRRGIDKYMLNGIEISRGRYENYKVACTLKEIKKLEEKEILVNERIMDIQASRCGVICPPSIIGSRMYSVVDESPVANISREILTKVFGISNFWKAHRRRIYGNVQPEQIQEAITILKEMKVERTRDRHFRCPFHSSYSKQSLWVGDQGNLYCFHCQRYWNDIYQFMRDINGIAK